MIRNTVYRIFLILGFLLVSIQLLDGIAIQGVTPDILLILVLFISQRRGVMEGQLTGFFSGLLQDIFSIKLFGIHAFSKMIIGFVTGHLYQNFVIDHIGIQALLGLIGTLVHGLLFFLSKLIFDHIDAVHYFSSVLWIKMLYTALLTPMIFWVLNFFEKRLGEP